MQVSEQPALFDAHGPAPVSWFIPTWNIFIAYFLDSRCTHSDLQLRCCSAPSWDARLISLWVQRNRMSNTNSCTCLGIAKSALLASLIHGGVQRKQVHSSTTFTIAKFSQPPATQLPFSTRAWNNSGIAGFFS